MRAVRTFFTGSIAAVAVVLGGCGSTTSDLPAGATDSGASADGTAPLTDSSFASDSPATGQDSAPISDGACQFSDADLNTATPADAALDDAGASVGTCLSCAQSKCQSDVTACNGDACCESVFACAFDCLSGVGASLELCYITCGGSLSASSVDPVETSLGKCALAKCATECAVCSLDAKLCPAPDAGPSDAGTDGADVADAAQD